MNLRYGLWVAHFLSGYHQQLLVLLSHCPAVLWHYNGLYYCVLDQLVWWRWKIQSCSLFFYLYMYTLQFVNHKPSLSGLWS